MNATTEQNSTHTPGPWMAAARPSSVVGWPVVSPADMGRSVCNVTVGHEASAANARLIAAAPELLRVAERMAHAASMDPGQDRLAAFQIVAEEARTAIAKATGAQS